MTIYKKVKKVIETTVKAVYVQRDEKNVFKDDVPNSLYPITRFVQLEAGELVTLNCIKSSSMFSVVSSCLESGSCPIFGYERAVRLGHNTHGTIQCPTVVSKFNDSKKVEVVVLKVGQFIFFEGRFFKVIAEPNDNIGLREITG